MKRGNRIKYLGSEYRPQLSHLKGKKGIITAVLPENRYEVMIDDYLYLGIINMAESEIEKISFQ